MLEQEKQQSFSVPAPDTRDTLNCTARLVMPNDSQEGYELTIEGEGRYIGYDMPKTPDDVDVCHMAGFIDKAVREIYGRDFFKEQRVLTSQIMHWASPLVIHDACTRLALGESQADHHFITFGHKEMDSKANAGCGRSKTVLLKKNDKVIKVLNSKTLKSWLARNPNTLIDLTDGGEYVEKALTCTQKQYQSDEPVIHDDRWHLMTPTNRFNIKLASLDDSSLRFSVLGIKVFDDLRF